MLAAFVRHRVRIGLLCLLGGLAAAAFPQARGRVWARYEHEMQDPVDDPPDVGRKGEFIVGRLRYRSPMDHPYRRYARWGIDANKGDRIFLGLLQRLTRVDTEPIETIIDVDSQDMFNTPFLLGISVGDWVLSPDQAKRLGDYLKRGGFLMVDDFHNDREWEQFMAGIRQMGLPSEPVELQDDEPAFHVLFDLKERFRVPGQNVVHGSQIERGGTYPHWRGIFDAKGRMIVAISFNQDMGDGWEFADDPDYPERYSTQAIKLGTNYALYSMTH